MFCSKCGREQDDSATFCSSCGAALKTPQNPNSTSRRSGGTNWLGWMAVLAGIAVAFSSSASVPREVLLLVSFVALFSGLTMVLAGSSSIIRAGKAFFGTLVVLTALVFVRDTIYPQETMSAEPDVVVQVEQIVQDYRTNEIAADERYKGKVVQTTGFVNAVGKDLADAPFLTIGPTTGELARLVQCGLVPAAAASASRVREGDRVTIRGRVIGLMINVQLRDCFITPTAEVAEKSPARTSSPIPEPTSPPVQAAAASEPITTPPLQNENWCSPSSPFVILLEPSASALDAEAMEEYADEKGQPVTSHLNWGLRDAKDIDETYLTGILTAGSGHFDQFEDDKKRFYLRSQWDCSSWRK